MVRRMKALAATRSPRILLIIAPTLMECYHAAREHGLEPAQAENFRCIRTAHELRGVSAGSPYILINRDSWPATAAGFDLDQALSAMQRLGRVRPAREDDLEACMPFSGKAAAE